MKISKTQVLIGALLGITGFLSYRQYFQSLAKDYIVVTNDLKPIITDSFYNTTHFFIKDSGRCNQTIILAKKQISSKFRFDNPLIISNLKTEKSNPGGGLQYIRYINDSTLGAWYYLSCPDICYRICRPPCPPPLPECRPSLKINFDCQTSYFDTVKNLILHEQLKSSVKTVFISEYKDFPKTGTYKVEKWKYTSNVKIYKRGKLSREYDVSDEIQRTSKVVSYILNNKLIVEYYE